MIRVFFGTLALAGSLSAYADPRIELLNAYTQCIYASSSQTELQSCESVKQKALSAFSPDQRQAMESKMDAAAARIKTKKAQT